MNGRCRSLLLMGLITVCFRKEVDLLGSIKKKNYEKGLDKEYQVLQVDIAIIKTCGIGKGKAIYCPFTTN